MRSMMHPILSRVWCPGSAGMTAHFCVPPWTLPHPCHPCHPCQWINWPCEHAAVATDPGCDMPLRRGTDAGNWAADMAAVPAAWAPGNVAVSPFASMTESTPDVSAASTQDTRTSQGETGVTVLPHSPVWSRAHPALPRAYFVLALHDMLGGKALIYICCYEGVHGASDPSTALAIAV